MFGIVWGETDDFLRLSLGYVEVSVWSCHCVSRGIWCFFLTLTRLLYIFKGWIKLVMVAEVHKIYGKRIVSTETRNSDTISLDKGLQVITVHLYSSEYGLNAPWVVIDCKKITNTSILKQLDLAI